MKRSMRLGVLASVASALVAGAVAYVGHSNRKQELNSRYEELLAAIHQEIGYHRAAIRALADADATTHDLHDFLTSRPVYRLANVRELVAEVAVFYDEKQLENVVFILESSGPLVDYLVGRLVQHPGLAVTVVERHQRMNNVTAHLSVRVFDKDALTPTDKSALNIMERGLKGTET